jgi:hypothetical protein
MKLALLTSIIPLLLAATSRLAAQVAANGQVRHLVQSARYGNLAADQRRRYLRG